MGQDTDGYHTEDEGGVRLGGGWGRLQVGAQEGGQGRGCDLWGQKEGEEGRTTVAGRDCKN